MELVVNQVFQEEDHQQKKNPLCLFCGQQFVLLEYFCTSKLASGIIISLEKDQDLSRFEDMLAENYTLIFETKNLHSPAKISVQSCMKNPDANASIVILAIKSLTNCQHARKSSVNDFWDEHFTVQCKVASATY